VEGLALAQLQTPQAVVEQRRSGRAKVQPALLDFCQVRDQARFDASAAIEQSAQIMQELLIRYPSQSPKRGCRHGYL
jgi:hypothetical protein